MSIFEKQMAKFDVSLHLNPLLNPFDDFVAIAHLSRTSNDNNHSCHAFRDVYDIALTYSFASMKNRSLNFADQLKSKKSEDVIDEALII